MSREPLIWLITGTSSGLGRDIAISALSRGDRVIATTRKRSLAKLEDLKALGADVLELDVTESLEILKEIAKVAIDIHGKVDVVVNNAGFAHIAAFEELTPEEDIDVFNTNILGAMNIARAFLPYMRKEKSGTVLWIGSLASWRVEIGISTYAATKGAMRALSECLDAEISPLGLRSVVIEFGYFATEMIANAAHIPSRIADYNANIDPVRTQYKAFHGYQPGDPKKGAGIVVDIVHGEGVASGKTIPPVIGLGTDQYHAVKEYCSRMVQVMDNWGTVACSTDHEAKAIASGKIV